MRISPDAYEFIVVADGEIKYRTDKLRLARSYKAFLSIKSMGYGRVSIFGHHRMLP